MNPNEPSPCLTSDHDQQVYNIQASDSKLCDGLWCTNDLCDPSLWNFLPELLEQDSLPEEWNHSSGTFSSQVGTEHGDSSPASIFTCPLVSSTPEQDEDEPEGLVPTEVAILAKPVVSPTGINIDIKVATPGVPVLPAKLSLPGCVVDSSRTPTAGPSACPVHHPRLAPSKAEMNRLFKGVMKKKNSNKWQCEIRFAEKLLKVSKLKKGKQKLRLGTFDTKVQAARALQVGRFLLSEKKKLQYPAYFEQPFKSALSEFKKNLRAQPIDTELVDKVKDLAYDYSTKAGSNCELCFYSVKNLVVGIPNFDHALGAKLG